MRALTLCSLPVRLGLFDPADDQQKFEPELVGSPKYQALSKDASRQGLTLLSNSHAVGMGSDDVAKLTSGGGGVLPLQVGKRIAVIGPSSATRALMVGGTGAVLDSTEIVCKDAKDRDDWFCVQSPFEAIAAINGNASTTLSTGATIDPEKDPSSLSQLIVEAVTAAKAADTVVFVIGDDWGTEHEGMDRQTIELPGNQAELVSAVTAAVGPAVGLVAVLVHGASMDISSVLNDTHAVLDSFYPGIYGAAAIADTLFGRSVPGAARAHTFNLPSPSTP